MCSIASKRQLFSQRLPTLPCFKLDPEPVGYPHHVVIKRHYVDYVDNVRVGPPDITKSLYVFGFVAGRVHGKEFRELEHRYLFGRQTRVTVIGAELIS